jgi:C-terminal processing protease CtpA/Prc
MIIGLNRTARVSTTCLALMTLAACGGQSDSQRGVGNGGGNGGGNGTVSYTAGVFQPYKGIANRCTTAAEENNWLRSWINDTYLWYREVPDLNPNSYSDPLDYFDLLRTSATTPSGADKDKFHFWYPTDEWERLSQSGISAGYGAQFALLAATPPRDVRVAYVDPGTPAANAGLQRGDMVIAIDGADAINGNTDAIVDTLNAGLFPEGINETHQIRLRSNDGSERTVSLTSATVTSTPVQNVKVIDQGVRVGYLLFNDHIATAEQQLISAINTLNAGAGVDELVLDIRYNGGGYLYIASELAYMIAGPSRTSGQTFERLTFNDKYPNNDAVTGQALQPIPFFSTSDNNAPLPTLNLNRVFVLTGAGTCSASESIINGLQGVGVEVVQIGGTTCGKPYGFYATDNCDTTYFAIQFKGVNADGFGDYTDGFSPQNTVTAPGTTVPGCSVRDDFARQLGDPTEGRLAAALGYIGGGMCPAPPSGPVGVTKQGMPGADAVLLRSPLRENRILGRPGA